MTNQDWKSISEVKCWLFNIQFLTQDHLIVLFNIQFQEYCQDYDKLPHILPAKKRIICLGDLHGDYELTLSCLKIANVIRFFFFLCKFSKDL